MGTFWFGDGDLGTSGKVGKEDGTTQKGKAVPQIFFRAFAPSLMENVEELFGAKARQAASGMISLPGNP